MSAFRHFRLELYLCLLGIRLIFGPAVDDLVSQMAFNGFTTRPKGSAQGQAFFTQDEFNKALGEAKAEIMAVAIQTTKQAIFMERQACAEMAFAYEAKLAGKEDDENFDSPLANNILNRIPAQRQ